MQGLLAAEPAVLVDLDAVGIVLLVFHRVVITLLAFAACQSYTNSHDLAPPIIIFISLIPVVFRRTA